MSPAKIKVIITIKNSGQNFVWRLGRIWLGMLLAGIFVSLRINLFFNEGVF